MILGTEARVRPVVDLLECSTDSDAADPPAWPDPREHREHRDERDRGRYFTPRLYPSAPFDPWEPVSVKDSM